MTQTSVEYRHKSDIVLRINYDNLNGHLTIPYPINSNLTYTGKISFSDIIGGIGYRDVDGKHNFTFYIQGGLRRYGFPFFESLNNLAQINFPSRNVGVMRYTAGYEFALAPKMFLTLEGFIGHSLKEIDYWEENSRTFGINLGLSAPLF